MSHCQANVNKITTTTLSVYTVHTGNTYMCIATFEQKTKRKTIKYSALIVIPLGFAPDLSFSAATTDSELPIDISVQFLLPLFFRNLAPKV